MRNPLATTRILPKRQNDENLSLGRLIYDWIKNFKLKKIAKLHPARPARGEPTEHCKTQRMEGEISIVQSIQLGFSRSLGSATSNEANKSAMRRAVHHHRGPSRAPFGPNEYPCFVLECCNQNAIFSVTGYHNRSYLDNISTTWQTGDILSVSSMGTAAA